MKFRDDQVAAIVWAQWKIIFNRYPREGAGRLIVTIGFSALWYLMICAGATMLAMVIPEAPSAEILAKYLGPGLLLGTLYWQVVPVILVSAGMSLELKRLLVYPVLPLKLFGIEVVLRVTTGAEVLILLCGATAGLWMSPYVHWWGPFFFLPFAAANMFVSVGVRDLLSRLLARKYVREAVIFGIVLLSALPQLLMTTVKQESLAKYRGVYERLQALLPNSIPWPWRVTSDLVMGQGGWRALAWLAFWVALGAWFGYRQFRRGLIFDAAELRAKERPAEPVVPSSWSERLFRLPSRWLPEPLGALVEKDLRFLSRAPRFRLVFFMGFTFGLIIWMPLLLRSGGAPPGVFGRNFLTVVSLYACLMLGEVLFWNVFGFERSAAQAYWVMPVRMRTVLIGKNVTALLLLFLEITLVVLVCTLLGLRYPLSKIIESFMVTLLLAVFLLGAGNLASVNFPRAINPVQSWRHSSAGRTQLYMLLLYPVISLPIMLAYMARYAFEADWAFYVVLGMGMLIGLIFYSVAMDSALEAAEKRKEAILAVLSQSEGPMS